MPMALTSIGTLPAACAASVWSSAPPSHGDGADLGERLQDADLVVGGHHRDEHGLVGDRLAQLVEADEAVAVDAEPRDAPALALEPLERIEHRLVLGCDVTHVIAAVAAGVRRALDGEVVRLGRAAGEDDLARRRADERGDLGARALDRFLRLPAERVLAARGLPNSSVKYGSIASRTRRIDRRGGVVVEVDGLSLSWRGHRSGTQTRR